MWHGEGIVTKKFGGYFYIYSGNGPWFGPYKAHYAIDWMDGLIRFDKQWGKK